MESKRNSTQLAIVLLGCAALLVFAFALVVHHREVPERVRAHAAPASAG